MTSHAKHQLCLAKIHHINLNPATEPKFQPRLKFAFSLPATILENMYVTPKNFGVVPDDLRQPVAYFTQLFGGSNRWYGINPKHFKNNVSCGISKIHNLLSVLANIFAGSDVCGFVSSEGWQWSPHPFLLTEK